MPIWAAMSAIGRNVACRAISMAGGRGIGTDHARHSGGPAACRFSQDAPLRPTLAVTPRRTGAWGPLLGAGKERSMSKADGVFIYIGTYASEVDARADYD